MKKNFALIMLICMFITGCNSNKTLQSDTTSQIEETSQESSKKNDNQNSLIDLSLYLHDIEGVEGYYGFISSYIFKSTNQNLIKFLANQACDIEFSEVLTAENMDPTDNISNRSFTFYLQGGCLSLLITEKENMYAIYSEIVEDANVEGGHSLKTIWQYKAIKPEQRQYFLTFTGLGLPLNHYWCKTPVCTSYIGQLDQYIQDRILYSFIDNYSPVQEFLLYGTLFSGKIKDYFGFYQNKYYAIIIDDCGLEYIACEQTVEIDGVVFNYCNGNKIYLTDTNNFIDLKTAYDNKIINHDDLLEIANRLNNNK